MTMHKPRLQVTAALIVREDGLVLITQRPQGTRHAGRWDFPGGKQEPGETLPECLQREIREELELEIEIIRHLLSVDHDYAEFSLTLHGFLCRPLSSHMNTAHFSAVAWVEPGGLSAYDLLPPDRPLARELAGLQAHI